MGASGGRQSREMNEMRPIQEILVEEHIHALQREAASVRQERRRIANDTPARREGGNWSAVGRWCGLPPTRPKGYPSEAVR